MEQNTIRHTPVRLTSAQGALITLLLLCVLPPAVADSPPLLPLPENGTLYHGVFAPVSGHRSEMEISWESIRSYAEAAGKNPAIVVFSHEWRSNRTFPLRESALIRSTGAVPYIRLMIRSDTRQYQPEPLYTLARIRDGRYDRELSAWAQDARAFGSPIIVEWGTEVNGNWFPWNGFWNRGEEGARRFSDAYRHIITLMREEGAANIIWVYHVNWNSVPSSSWNGYSSYYPGDEYIDWIGVSLYGDLYTSGSPGPFSSVMEQVYPALEGIGREKPLFISEFGTDLSGHAAAVWTRDALSSLVSGRWPRIIGFAWWNAAWPDARSPDTTISLRIEESQEISALFREYIGENPAVRDRVPLPHRDEPSEGNRE